MTRAGADPLLLLVAGLAIDAVFGDMPAIFRYVDHPVALAGRAIAFFDRKLNREARSEASRRDRGIITVIVLVGAAAALGCTIERLCRGHPLGAIVEALLIAVLVAQRSLYQHVAEQRIDCKAGDQQRQWIGPGPRHRAFRPRRRSGRVGR